MRSFHDHNVSAISIRGSTLKLEISRNDQEHTYIEVDGLEKLRISDMEEGNVIANLRVFSVENYSMFERKIMACIRYVYRFDDEIENIDPKNEDYVVSQFSLVAHGKIIVLEIEPSYGCYLVAFGRSARELA